MGFEMQHFAKKTCLVLALSLTVTGCAPQHSRSTGFLQWKADPGYSFQDSKALFPKAVWSPGATDPAIAHIVAASAEGYWTPAPGYDWNGSTGASPYAERPTDQRTQVHWQKGLSHPDHPHIFAADRADDWTAVKGYQFLSADTLETRWVQGLEDPDRPHYLSAAVEGQWELEAGYREQTDTLGATYAAWTPGLSYPDNACLVSGDTEGRWGPVSGHHLVSDATGNLEIVADSTDPDWGKAIGQGVLAVIAYLFAQPQSDDSSLTSAGRHLAGNVGDHLAVGAIQSVFDPNGNDQCNGVVLPSRWKIQS